MDVIALHGFLGLPEDWEPFSDSFGRLNAIDLWAEIESTPSKGSGLETWARDFTSRVREGRYGTKPVLIGYSMGGRLAMHALTASPELFSAAVIISAHPGLTDDSLREPRAESDRRWAMRFLAEDWKKLIGDWTAQDVFKRPVAKSSEDAVELTRQESKFSRPALARAITAWSLAHQRDLRPALHELKVPVLFICGKNDGKFEEILRSVRLNASQELVVVDGAGHRVFWDQPRALRREVVRFLSKYGLD